MEAGEFVAVFTDSPKSSTWTLSFKDQKIRHSFCVLSLPVNTVRLLEKLNYEDVPLIH